jgi:hypothetical protein
VATKQRSDNETRLTRFGLFQNDFLWRFIISPAQERRLAELLVGRDFGKSDFANQLWFDPLDLLFDLWRPRNDSAAPCQLG